MLAKKHFGGRGPLLVGGVHCWWEGSSGEDDLKIEKRGRKTGGEMPTR